MLMYSFRGTDGVEFENRPVLTGVEFENRPVLQGVGIEPKPLFHGVEFENRPVLNGVQIDKAYLLRGCGFAGIDASTYFTTSGGTILALTAGSATETAFKNLQTAINAAAVVVGKVTGAPVTVDGEIGRGTATAARDIIWSLKGTPVATDPNGVVGKLIVIADKQKITGTYAGPDDYALISALAADADSLTGLFNDIATKKTVVKKKWSMTTKVAVASGGVLAIGLLAWGTMAMLKKPQRKVGLGRGRGRLGRHSCGCR